MVRKISVACLYNILLIFIVTPIVFAGTVSITPTRLELSREYPITVLRATNPTASPVVMQLKVKRWIQKNQRDVYLETKDILVTPPIFKLLPQQSQIIRFALLNQKINLKKEGTYRVFLREVPPSFRSRKFLSSNGLNVILQISLPLFIKPEGEISTKVAWKGKWLEHHLFQLRLNNLGNMTVFINQLQLFKKNRVAITPKMKTFSYVLPEQSHSWIFHLKPISSPIHVVTNPSHLASYSHDQVVK